MRWSHARLKANMKWTDMRTNKSVFEEVEMEQGDLLKRVIRRKATFVGHISRMNDDRLLKRVWEIRDGHREVKRGRRRTEVDAEVTKMFGHYKSVKEREREMEGRHQEERDARTYENDINNEVAESTGETPGLNLYIDAV